MSDTTGRQHGFSRPPAVAGPHEPTTPRRGGSRLRVAIAGAAGTAALATVTLAVATVLSGAEAAGAAATPAAPVSAVTAPARPPTRTPDAACRPTARACVQLSTQHVWLLDGGRVTRDGFVSSGTTDVETPTGDFRVQYEDATHCSSEYDTPMPWSVFFDTHGDALHQGSLARQSRGCVHLTQDDAVAFFDALRPGDEVQILP